MSLLAVLMVLMVVLLSPVDAAAETATSSSYLLETGNFSALDFQGESSSYSLSGNMNTFDASHYAFYLQNNDGMYTGFPLMMMSFMSLGTPLATTPTVNFTIDRLVMNFGSMYPNTFATQSNNITIQSDSVMGYDLYLQQNHRLQNLTATQASPEARQIIANTTCDSGSCNYLYAGAWNDPANAGFGYTVISSDAPNDFGNGTYYRPVATEDLNQDPSLIGQSMLTTQTLGTHTLQVKYQVSISAENVAGNYSNAISYILVPQY